LYFPLEQKNSIALTPLFKKLNFKDHHEILVLNAPHAFESELNALRKHTTIRTTLEMVDTFSFALVFVTTQAQIETLTSQIKEKAVGDAVLWYAYPKKTSKNYQSDITRDQGWKPLGAAGFEGVRQVAIDDDWSALRFRKVEFIKTMNRRTEFAMTEEGKQKTRK
jgi:hypothetical protein